MRSKFDPRSTYAGRLDRVTKRSIENQIKDAVLLRLEFLIFRIQDHVLSTRGQLACRDIMLWPGIEKDPGVLRMAHALGIEEPYSTASWLSAPDHPRWITIRFGDPSLTDHRQQFVEIHLFSPEAEGFKLSNLPHLTNTHWASVQVAAQELGVSNSTVRRMIDFSKKEHGESLVRYTAGGHRRINLPLLRHLMGH